MKYMESLKHVEPRMLSLIIGMLVALIITAISIYGIKPHYKQYTKNLSSLLLLNNQVDDPELIQVSIDDQRLEIQQLKLKLNGEAGDMPANEMESYMIGRLQNLSWDAGVQLISVRPGVAKQVLNFDEISFEVNVWGDYRSLYAWLNKLSSNLGFLMVSKYNIRSISQKSFENTLDMSVTLIFYRAAT